MNNVIIEYAIIEINNQIKYCKFITYGTSIIFDKTISNIPKLV